VTEDSDKVPPERLELRARPRPIRRLNKRTLMIGCAVAALFIAGATIVALSPPRIFKPGERTELYNTDRKQTADGLSKLPKSYENLPPKLGPPSPGDVGRALPRVRRNSERAQHPRRRSRQTRSRMLSGRSASARRVLRSRPRSRASYFGCPTSRTAANRSSPRCFALRPRTMLRRHLISLRRCHRV
jgi:type IV secretory pathway VirB10-like protein